MIRRSLILAALISALVCASVHAEVIGPLLPKAAFEAGMEARSVNREVYYGSDEFDWEEVNIPVVARWGITNLATISIEAARSAVWVEGDFKDSAFDYLVGGAVQASLWRNEKVIVSAAFQFTSTMLRLEDGPVRNVTTSTAGGQVIVQRPLLVGGVNLDVWGGPAYSLFYPDIEKQLNSVNSKELYTESNWGAVLGVGALFWKHLDLSSYVLWVENPQPRVALLYRF